MRGWGCFHWGKGLVYGLITTSYMDDRTHLAKGRIVLK